MAGLLFCAMNVVLRRARHVRLGRGVFAMAAHMHVASRAPQSVLDHPIDHRLIADLDAALLAVAATHRFVFQNPETPVFTVPPVGGLLSAQVGVTFP